MSELEKKLRDARHQAELYEQELKRTDSYDEQIRLTKLIIEQKKLEADALESLMVEKDKEIKLAKDDTAVKDELVKEYQKLAKEAGSLETEIYTLIKSMDELDEKQREVLKENVSDYLKDLNDAYDKYFADQKNRYENDLDDFKKSQEEKIREVDEALKKMRESYEEETFIDEEEEILDKIAKLEKEKLKLKLATATNDLEAKRRTAEIDEQLEEENKTLSELRRDREYELDVQELEDKKDMIEEETRKREDEYDEQIRLLEQYQSEVEDTISNFEDDWSGYGSDLGSAFENGFIPAIQNILDKIKEIPNIDEGNIPDVSQGRPSSGGSSSGGSSSSRPSISDDDERKIELYKKAWEKYDEAASKGTLDKETADRYKKMANEKANEVREKYGYSGGTSGDDFIPIYHNGGIAGGGSFNGMNGMEALEYTLSGNEISAVLEKGEGVFTRPQMQDIAGAMGGDTNVNLNLSGDVSIGQNYSSVDEFSEDITNKIKQKTATLGSIIRR